MTKQQFLSFYKGNKDSATCYDSVVAELKNLNILTPLTIIAALATVRVEVGRSFKPVMEIASGEAYEGRKALGNTQKGDGVKYKGRGYIQITGRFNYKKYGDLIGVDLINKPQEALKVVNSAKILAHFFKQNKINVACERKDWAKVRKQVNGGSNGLPEFIRVVGEYLEVSNL